MGQALPLVLDHLRASGHNPQVEYSGDQGWFQITWTDETNDACFIYCTDFVAVDETLAWFQSSYQSRHLLKVHTATQVFAWVPLTHNPVFGCMCLMLEWVDDQLVFIYQEKHDIYICAVLNGQVRHHHFNGSTIQRLGNLVAYQTYHSPLVHLLELPQLQLLPPITAEAAAAQGVTPLGIDEEGGLLDQAERRAKGA